MDPLFNSLILQLVPQPRQMPLPPFDRDALQRIFSELIHRYPYQAFGFTPNGRGAIFQNGPEDAVELRPAEFKIQIKLDGAEPLFALTAEQKASAVLELAAKHLDVETFLQCGVQIIAHAAVPGEHPDAKAFVAEHLMKRNDQATHLGENYFAGGVRFRRVDEQTDGAQADTAGEDSLAIEPFLQDNTLVYLDYQVARVATQRPIRLEDLSRWIIEAFEFLSGPTMSLLAQ
jgi:hypothetical protein